MNIFLPVGSSARKIYEEKNGVIENRFDFKGRGRLIEHIPAEQYTLSRIADARRKAREVGGFLIRNRPKQGQPDELQIKKILFEDARLPILPVDVDRVVNDIDLLSPDPRSAADRWIAEMGIPPSVGYVVWWSSSRFIKGNRKESFHIVFLLTDSFNEEELKKLTATLDSDPAFCEMTRVICVQDPLCVQDPICEEDLLTEDISRYDEIVVVEGDRLDLTKISETNINIHNQVFSKEEQDQKDWNTGTWDLFAGLKEYFKDQGESVPWNDPKRLAKACAQLLQHRKIGQRHAIHYWLMRLAYERTGDTDASKQEILNSKVLLGNHEEQELIDQANKIKADFQDQTTGGDIASCFLPDEIISVECDSAKGLTEEQRDQLFEDNTLSCISAFEGFGKSYFVIRKGLDNSDPKTVISVCHRNAALKQQSKDWDLTYKDDIGKDDPSYEKLSEKNRKIEFWPTCDSPAITVQSLQYIARNGQVKKYETVLIDEIEHVLKELYIKPELQGKKDIYDRHAKQFHILFTICSQANNVIVADASASRDFTGWFIDEVIKFSEKKKKLLRTQIDYVSRMKFRELSTLEEAILTAVQLLKEGKKVAITTDHADNPDQGKIEKILLPIKSLANLKDNEIFSATADSSRYTEQGRLVAENPSEIGNMIDDGLKCLIVSPVFDSAWSYHLDGDYRFDAVIQIFAHGNTHAEDVKQMFRRFRLTTDVYTYMKPKFRMKVA